jgi:single-strand DNA-binding protein
MISLNRAMLVGNLTRDPELRYTPSGQPVCSFGLATNRRFKSASGELQERVEFHNIVAWGKLAEIVSQILKKGSKAYIDGRLQTRTWEGQDGIKRQRTEIIMENFIPLTPKGMTKEIEEIAEIIPKEEPPPEIIAEEPASKKSKTKSQEKKEKEEEIDLDEIPF